MNPINLRVEEIVEPKLYSLILILTFQSALMEYIFVPFRGTKSPSLWVTLGSFLSCGFIVEMASVMSLISRCNRKHLDLMNHG